MTDKRSIFLFSDKFTEFYFPSANFSFLVARKGNVDLFKIQGLEYSTTMDQTGRRCPGKETI